MYQQQNADKRLKEFIQGRVTASKAYIEACAWAKFSGSHSIVEISNMIDIVKEAHEKQGEKLVYQYTRRTYFQDGHTTTCNLERESLKSPQGFQVEVAEWNRQGQLTKHIDTLSPIQGYDYWITKEQLRANEIAYDKFHTISAS